MRATAPARAHAHAHLLVERHQLIRGQLQRLACCQHRVPARTAPSRPRPCACARPRARVRACVRACVCTCVSLCAQAVFGADNEGVHSPVGVVLGPVQTQFGYHLIKIMSRNMPSKNVNGAFTEEVAE